MMAQFKNMKNLDYEYTNKIVQDSITQKFSSKGALMIKSNYRVYFITKEFIDFAYSIFHERENKDTT